VSETFVVGDAFHMQFHLRARLSKVVVSSMLQYSRYVKTDPAFTNEYEA
jgi:hypothetical protein